MEPITLATSLASILGLVANFKAERSQSASDQYQDFIEWLIKGNHEQVVKGIEQNQKLGVSLKALLNQQSEVIVERLEKLDSLLAYVASRIDGLSDITKSMHPGIELSEQAISVLKQFVDSGVKEIIKIKVHTGDDDVYQFIGKVKSGKNKLEYQDPLFIEDDMSSLEKLGVITSKPGARGNVSYFITRAAVKMIDELGL